MLPRVGRLAAVLALGACTAAVSACGATPDGAGSGGAGTAPPGTLAVVASFYPLEYVVQQVGGAHVQVSTLTKPGAEPHDLELSPKQVGLVSTAPLVVYSRGFQSAVDAAVDQEAGDRALDVASAADEDLPAPAEHGTDPLHPNPDSAANEGDHETVHEPGAADPHFWLDPVRYAAVGDAVAARLAGLDPAHASAYRGGAAAFRAAMTTLDRDFAQGLRTCRSRDLVTSHAAFGYLARRYLLTQVSIAGLSPDVEPSAAQLAAIADFVRDHAVTTVYAEPLVDPAFAETIAHTTGAAVRTLDPVEGITPESAGTTYTEVMRANLAALREGQGCQ